MKKSTRLILYIIWVLAILGFIGMGLKVGYDDFIENGFSSATLITILGILLLIFYIWKVIYRYNNPPKEIPKEILQSYKHNENTNKNVLYLVLGIFIFVILMVLGMFIAIKLYS